MTKIPFDSLVLRAVIAEMQACVGAKVQDVRQPGPLEIAVRVFGSAGEATLFASAHPTFFRFHFATRRPSTTTPAPQLLAALRSRLVGARVEWIRQIGGDRIAEVKFSNEEGDSTLVVELMGTHANVVLLDQSRKVVSAAKWVARSKSPRPIQPGVPYQLPNLQSTPSRFQLALEAAGGDASQYGPILASGYGAYPVSVAALGYEEVARSSISIAIEQYVAQAIPDFESAQLRQQMLSRVGKLIVAREAAIAELEEARATGGKAGEWQRWGELVLAYGVGKDLSGGSLDVTDYDGEPVSIVVDPELDFLKNAERYFSKAKKAKARMSAVQDQLARLSDDCAALAAFHSRVLAETRLDGLLTLEAEAKAHRWLMDRPVAAAKEDRPYAGHRVRELLGPYGYTVLFGENAESNDYLTLRVARPNDWWLHVRGGVSAHVVIVTRNQPEKVQREVLEYAARIAVRNSPSKHSGYVAVDYTLKKHVRKPKGAAKGSALYTHEKTLDVDASDAGGTARP